MAISYVDSATNSAGDGADLTITLPTSLEDDIVIIALSVGYTADVAIGITTSGYTKLTELYADDTIDINLAVAWKRMGATPDTSVVCTNDGGVATALAGIAYVIRGVDTTTAFDVTTTTDTGIDSGIPDPPSITPTTAGSFIVIVGASTVNDVTITVPTGYTNHVAVSGDDQYDSRLAMASKAWTSGAEDPPPWTNWGTSTAHSWAAVTMALRPVGAEVTTIEPASGSIIVAGYVPVSDIIGFIAIGNASVSLSGQNLALLSTMPVTSASITLTGFAPTSVIARVLEPASASITIAGQSTSLISFIPIVSGNILAKGFAPLTFVWGGVPEFEIAELVPNPDYDPGHVPCGHWHDGQSDDPVWDFIEQADLPIPYHKHPIDPEICGHWHKQGPPPEICIEYVEEIHTSFYPNTYGQYTSGDAMIYHTDGYIYGGAFSEGTMFRLEPGQLEIDIQTTFDAADVSAIEQIIFYNGYLYAMIKRSGYTGNWVQKISIPATVSEAFELVDDPLYAGSVVTGTDNNVYGSFNSLNMTAGAWTTQHTPITGASWATGWERLPDDYSYPIDADVSVYEDGVTSGADLINFMIIPNDGYIFVTGPETSLLAYSAYVNKFNFDGTRVGFYVNYVTAGPNEIVMSPNSHDIALLRNVSVTTNLTMRRIDVNGGLNTDYLITGLLDADGNSNDNSWHHNRTIWHPANNLIYSFHNVWPGTSSRMVAIDSDGNLVYQYAWALGTDKGSFVILGDYVYVWQTGLHSVSHVSAIIKLTLELEFVCIEDCSGALNPNQIAWEVGRIMVSDGNEYIYNFARVLTPDGEGIITKYRTNPLISGDEVHDPVWEFTKQWDKF